MCVKSLQTLRQVGGGVRQPGTEGLIDPAQADVVVENLDRQVEGEVQGSGRVNGHDNGRYEDGPHILGDRHRPPGQRSTG